MKRTAIYARYNSDHQSPRSIDDQISNCKRFASEQGFNVIEDVIFSDKAVSGTISDRKGLNQLLETGEKGKFDIVQFDNLSRLSRDNIFMQNTINQLMFVGIRVISVSGGIDTVDENAELAIQILGIFHQQYLKDLKKKTLRGLKGQHERGFSVLVRMFSDMTQLPLKAKL